MSLYPLRRDELADPAKLTFPELRDTYRLEKARERILRNLTDPAHRWTRPLSTLYGTPPDLAPEALRHLVDKGLVEVQLVDGAHVYRLA